MNKFEFIKGKMPISAWVAPVPKSDTLPSFINDERYQEIAECGLNSIYARGEEFDKFEDEAINALKSAEKAGIKYFTYDERFVKEQDFDIKETMKLLNSFSSFGGIIICDEPGSLKFKILAKAKEKLMPYLKDKACYINLMPMYATATQLEKGWWEANAKGATSINYEKYVKEYVEIVKPQFISYDYYPFMGKFGDCAESYFEQMHIIKKYANKIDVPFFVFIQVVSWKKGVIRNMTKEEILWQVNSALCLGCKGIQYFTYWTPRGSGEEIFDDAMIDVKGNRTQRYYDVKEINKQVNACGKYLVDCIYFGLMSINKSICPIKNEQIIENFGNIKFNSDGDFLIGCFKYKENNSYFVLNNSLINTSIIELLINVEELTIISKGDKFTCDAKKISFKLSPSESLFILEK